MRSNRKAGGGDSEDAVKTEYRMATKKDPVAGSFFVFARHGRALTGASPEHAQIVGSV